ncbi:MAG: DUF2071 domain-containing protein [Chloroflexota bacterium]
MIQVPALRGLVRRRILVNFRVAPDVMERQLPAPFRPKLVDGWALAGVCLIRLEQMRPRGFPKMVGLASENAAHRVAVTWTDDGGVQQDGVYIPRRDTGTPLNALLGGRLFPGEARRGRFRFWDESERLTLKLDTEDGGGDVWLRARPARDLPSSSRFGCLDEALDFFVAGAVGYSATHDGSRLDGLRLHAGAWRLQPLDVDWVVSSYFADRARFPAGTVEYDSTFIVRDLPHEWQAVPCLCVSPPAVPRPVRLVG